MKRKRGVFLMALGLALLAAACGLVVWNEWEARRGEESSRQALAQVSAMTRAARELPADTDPEREMPTVEAEGRQYIGSLEIPALGLSLPVQSEWSYPALKCSPCRFSGSAYRGDLIVAGHNYSRHFGALKHLAPGDEVVFTDAAGNRFRYAVSQLEQLPGDALEELEAGEWELTLFTCTLSGRGRVAVRCALLD